VPAAEQEPDGDFIQRLAAAGKRWLALDKLWDIADSPDLAPAQKGADLFPVRPVAPNVRIAVASDRAFNFYYQDNLDLLEAWGACLMPFSPLADEVLPDGTQGIYIGGGFPEMFAAELGENTAMHRSLRAAVARGVPIYGECGGLMYMGRTLNDIRGNDCPMAGLAPFASTMRELRLTMGYRTGTTLRSSPILPRNTRVRGHEFHYSTLSDPVDDTTAAYSLDGGLPNFEGYAAGNVLASYIHMHFATDPSIAPRFVGMCSQRQANRRTGRAPT